MDPNSMLLCAGIIHSLVVNSGISRLKDQKERRISTELDLHVSEKEQRISENIHGDQ